MNKIELKNEFIDLMLSVRPMNCLINDGITTIDQLLNISDVELLKIPNFGHKCLKEVRDALDKYMNSDNPVCGFILEIETGLIDGIYYASRANIHDLEYIALKFDKIRPGMTHIPCLTSTKRKPKITSENSLSNAFSWNLTEKEIKNE
jgi:hypothetical protein